MMKSGYNTVARVYPVLVALFPVLILASYYAVKIGSAISTGVSLGFLAALYFLLSQIGRDRGKSLEKDLWKKWGGMPSVQVLRYSDNTLTTLTKERYHRKLQTLAATSFLPTEQTELANPAKADEVYEHWCKYLVAHTRDIIKFRLLYGENVSYGFRRNLWGLKPFAIGLLMVLTASSVAFSVETFGWSVMRHDYLFLGVHVSMGLLFLFWLFIVRASWIRIPAFAYGERLAESVEEF